MPLLFTYGSLQLDKVQLKLFGRLLEGEDDTLPGYRTTIAVLADPDVLATTGTATHVAGVATDDADAAIPGKLYRVTDADLEAIRPYDDPDFERIEARLGSGRTAWVYVKRPA